jgi:hypothetical protein
LGETALEGEEVTDRERLKHEICVLGDIIEANAVVLASKTMNNDDRELLRRQMTRREATRKLLQARLDRAPAAPSATFSGAEVGDARVKPCGHEAQR